MTVRLSGRELAIGVAIAGWVVAVLLAMATVAWLGFFGLGLIGILIWFICVRVDLEKEGAVGSPFSTSLYAMQVRSREGASRSDRARHRHKQGLLVQSMRLAKMLGMGLTAVGFGGFLLTQI